MPPALHLATFHCDVTPPIGHPLCGGWIAPVGAVDDRLELRGVVLLGGGAPVVLAALDWCGLRNEAHQVWQKALAQAAHTAPENVALHCVHQHNAPFADLTAQRYIDQVSGAPSNIDRAFYDQVVRRSSDALNEALKHTLRFDSIGIGQAKVAQVASNRRILGPDGKVKITRFSATKDPAIRAEPEGVIDPYLRTLSFWQGDQPLAALHYYATHPMSYYGDGRVSSDFCGLARKKRQRDDPGVFQIYFTGCAGDITAGKYNDGSPENRSVLRDRVYQGMVDAWQTTRCMSIKSWTWHTLAIKFPPRKEPSFQADASWADLRNEKIAAARRGNAAFQLAWLDRWNVPIILSCLRLGNVRLLHLPGEPFIEFQLQAPRMVHDGTVLIAGYGDGGPGYIPTETAYAQGGYEPTVALVAPEASKQLMKALEQLLRS